MERREHYDPEDIEQLLMERGFDELLDEERAYVLRHLSGREEYEAMRSLLITVQRTEPEHDLLEPDEAVRDRVLAAYREQNRPGWRVWLNSVGATLLPRDASAMWRPALALGSIALLIGAALWVLRPSPAKEVAELNRPNAAEQEKVTRKEKPEGPAATTSGAPIDQAAAEPAVDAVAPPPVANEEMTLVAQARQVAAVAEDLADDATPTLQAAPAASAATESEEESLARTDAGTKAMADSAFDTKYVAVTNSGYTSNWSTANAQGTVTLEVAKAKDQQARAKRAAARKEDASAPLPDERVLALLRAAW